MISINQSFLIIQRNISYIEVEVQEENDTIIIDSIEVINQIKSNIRHRKGHGFNQQIDCSIETNFNSETSQRR